MFEGDRFWVRHFLTPFFCWGFPPCPQRLLLLSAFERYLGCFMAHPNVARMHDARKRGAEMRHHGVGDAQTQGSYLYTTLVWQPKTSDPLWVRGYVEVHTSIQVQTCTYLYILYIVVWRRADTGWIVFGWNQLYQKPPHAFVMSNITGLSEMLVKDQAWEIKI